MTNTGPIPNLKVGSIVGYVLDGSVAHGEVRPAIVVKIWDEYHGTSQLQVFRDSDGESGYNDGGPSVEWKTSITYSHEKTPGTWHFIE